MARRRNSAPDLPPYRLMAPGGLKPYENNPRTHPPEQIAAIVRSIREFGFTVPVLIGSDGGIIAGHGRALAAIQMGLDEIPVIELAHLTVAQRRAYVLADNALAQQSGWDEGMLKLELGALKLDGFDLSLVGFSELQITGFLDGPADDAEPSRSGNLAAQFGIPPFSVLNAREGWWQDRKRAWLALGIQSELGRGAAPGGGSDAAGSPSQAKPSSNATPGGAKMPAADYSPARGHSEQRGDGRGRPVNG